MIVDIFLVGWVFPDIFCGLFLRPAIRMEDVWGIIKILFWFLVAGLKTVLYIFIFFLGWKIENDTLRNDICANAFWSTGEK